jgi:RNA polymerase sigma-54 factor
MLAQSQKLMPSLEQGLRMNQQMLSSIKLMELPALELRARIEEELAANPALDVVEKAREEAPVKEVAHEDTEEGDFFETAIMMPLYTRNAPSDGDEKRQFLEGAVSRPESLQEHLLWQFRLQKLDGETRRIGELVIGNLDEDGFHLTPLAELLPGADTAKIAAALSVIRTLDPPGCATEDYRESLVEQGRLRFGKAAGDSIRVLLPCLSMLEKEKFSLAARQTGMRADQVALLFSRIKTLSPFPGRLFSGSAQQTARFVVPDIEVFRKDGELVIKLHDEEIPALRVSPFFTELQKGGSGDQNTQDFVNGNIAQAKWFINAVNKRNRTLLRVTQAIVERQKAFFDKGPAHVAPLTQRDIAETLSLNDSTVSRTANGKYLQTEWGIYEISHFFSNAITGNNPRQPLFSQAGVKEMIKEIIAGSGKHVSDIEITRLLLERGVQIARRTVAKYRNELRNR